MMRWYGPRPFSQACEPGDRLETLPSGATCAHCDEVIAEIDEAYAIPFLVAPAIKGSSIVTIGAEVLQLKHAECFMVAVVGRPLCILTHGPGGVCMDGIDRDPDGMTKRESARLADRLASLSTLGLLDPGSRLAREALVRYFPEYDPSRTSHVGGT